MCAKRASWAAGAEVFPQLEVGPTVVVVASYIIVVVVVEHLFLVVVGGVVRLTLLIHAVRLLGKEVVQRLEKINIFFFRKYFSNENLHLKEYRLDKEKQQVPLSMYSIRKKSLLTNPQNFVLVLPIIPNA